MKTMRFNFSVRPQVKERPRQGRIPGTDIPIFYTAKKTRQFEDFVREAVRYEMGAQGWAAFSKGVPVLATIRSTFAVKDKKLWGLYRCGGSDTDNLAKAILDSLNGRSIPDPTGGVKRIRVPGIAFHDDSQVVVLHSSKGYGEEDRVELELIEVASDGFMALPIFGGENG